METYITRIRFINTLKEKNISLFTLSDIQKLFYFESKNTLKHMLLRLSKEKIIKKLTRGKYLFLLAKKDIFDFTIANFLVFPSYISLDTALSYYGILSQFPYGITSITLLKSRRVKLQNKLYIFSRIKNQYFRDFVKIDDFLIATREKALFDYLYFIYKGLRPISSIVEFELYIKEKNVIKYIRENSDKILLRFLKKHVKL